MPKRNLAWILVVATIAFLMWQLPQTIAVRDSVYDAFGPLVEVRAEIHRRFVDKVDDARLVNAAVRAGLRAMVAELNDPYSVYLDAEEYSRFRNQTDGLFGGIGLDVWTTPAGLEVLSREPNSPAVEAGILPGDIITHVDGQPTRGVQLVEAVSNMLNGPPGTEVLLTVVTPADNSPAAIREVRLRREVIHLDPVRGWSRSVGGGWRFMLDPEARIGYLKLTKFTPDVDERMDAVVSELMQTGLRGLVLDLRDNTGGLFDSGLAVADRFLESGLLVRRDGRKSDAKQWFASREGTYPAHLRLALLINEHTASAAELVAGALRDHGRAIVVGERSYGKGCVQEVVDLQQGGALKLTMAYYYLPGGRCIHRLPQATEWGVEPTIRVPLTAEQRETWVATRREIAREILPEPATRAADPAAAPAVESQEQRAAEALLDADIQLREAVNVVRLAIDPQLPRLGPAAATTAPAADDAVRTP